MGRILLAIALTSTLACRSGDKDRRPATRTTAEAEGCPSGTETMGAPRPRGAGMWCQSITDGQLRVFHLDGKLWAEGHVDDKGMQGEVKFFAPDGRVALVRRYRDNHTDGDDDVRITGVELPPTILSVCSTNDPPSTTPCAK